MKNNSRLLRTSGLLVLFILYTFILIFPADSQRDILWVGLGFAALSVLIGTIALWFFSRSPKEDDEPVYQAPVVAMTFGYAGAEMLLGTIASCLPDSAIHAFFTVELFVSVIGAGLLFYNIFSNIRMLKKKNEPSAPVFNPGCMAARVASIGKRADNDELAHRIADFSEAFLHSESASAGRALAMDQRLCLGVSELSDLVDEGSTSNALRVVYQLQELLKERNQICRDAKQSEINRI